ncbi:MAG: DUF3015 family protein [Nitrospira sp.]
MRTLPPSVFAIAGLAIGLVMSGCTLKATFEQITDTTSNVTGTTSSAHSWVTEDGLLRPEHKAIAFMTFNQTNIQQNVAAGQGEYLASLGTLLGVPAHRQLAYGTAVQSRYARDLGEIDQTPAAWLSVLNDTAQPFRSDTAELIRNR